MLLNFNLSKYVKRKFKYTCKLKIIFCVESSLILTMIPKKNLKLKYNTPKYILDEIGKTYHLKVWVI